MAVENLEGIFKTYIQVKHQSDCAMFLNLDITIKEGNFIYKLFVERYSFPFFMVRMHHFGSNIQQNIFYSAIKGDFFSAV